MGSHSWPCDGDRGLGTVVSRNQGSWSNSKSQVCASLSANVLSSNCFLLGEKQTGCWALHPLFGVCQAGLIFPERQSETLQNGLTTPSLLAVLNPWGREGTWSRATLAILEGAGTLKRRISWQPSRKEPEAWPYSNIQNVEKVNLAIWEGSTV